MIIREFEKQKIWGAKVLRLGKGGGFKILDYMRAQNFERQSHCHQLEKERKMIIFIIIIMIIIFILATWEKWRILPKVVNMLEEGAPA